MAAQNRFEVFWTATAELDLKSILDHIAIDDADAALSILKRLETKASSLASMPERGRLVPELQEQGVELYRELIVGPWRIVFRIIARSVFVLAVLDSRRNLEDLLLERFLRHD